MYTNEFDITKRLIEYIENNESWEQLICSMPKEALKDFLNNEERCMYFARAEMAVRVLYQKLCETMNDGKLHCMEYVDEGYRGGDFLFFKNGAVCKPYFTSITDRERDFYCMEVKHLDYIRGNNKDEFIVDSNAYFERRPNTLSRDKDDIFLALRDDPKFDIVF